jgi:dephospho-CoA kinase
MKEAVPERPRRSKPLLGLIGGIGSGKSVVAAMLAELGGYVIDADRLGHEALRQPEIRDRVAARWGSNHVLNVAGEVDRHRVAEIVFADENERRALETMVFPWIEKRIQEEIERAERDQQVCLIILDAAILLETGWGRECNRLIFVNTPREERLKRLAETRGWTSKEVERRELAQLSLEEKAAKADFVIDNTGDLAQTKAQIERLVRDLHGTLPFRKT